MTDYFAGQGHRVKTEKDKEHPTLYVKLREGMVAKAIWIGWLPGGRYPDQPVFFSPIKGQAFALPAHTVLLNKLAECKPFTPMQVTCTRAPAEGSKAAYLYDVITFPPITDDATLTQLRKVHADFVQLATDKKLPPSDAPVQDATEDDDLPF